MGLSRKCSPLTTFARQRQGTYLLEEDPYLYTPHGTSSRGLRNHTCNYLMAKHYLYFLDYGRKQIIPSMIFSTVDIMHFLSYRKMFRACGPSTISYRMEVHYIHSRKYHLGTICILYHSNSVLTPNSDYLIYLFFL